MVSVDGPAGGPARGRFRWVVCALLLIATTINYMDRQVLGLLKPLIMADLGWCETNFGDVVAVFSAMYALGYACMGRLMDRIGVRLGLSLAVAGWSLCACLQGAMSGVLGFKLARGGLGLMEGGHFPAAISAIADWFPARERALATGLFNAGSNIGAMATPVVLPFIVVALGWHWAFVVIGGLGFLWLAAWWLLYDRPERKASLSPGELALIRAGRVAAAPQPSWLSLLRYRGTWVFIVGMLLVNSVWWFYLNWVPGYLHRQFGVDLMGAMAPLVAIYSLADFGSVGGGWLSSFLIRRGVPVLAARQWALLATALCVVPVALVSRTSDLWVAVALIGLAAAAHQGFAANLYTIVSDTMPGDSVSSVIGLGGFAGGITGMFMALAIGRVLDATGGNYTALFVAASVIYPATVGVLHLMLRSRRT